MNIVFFGSSKFVIPILEVLQKNFDLKLALTTENPKVNLASQGETLRSYPVVNYCIKNKISYLSVQQPARNQLSPPPDTLCESMRAGQATAGGFNNLTIQQLQVIKSPVAILADFGLIIPPEILNLFPKGILNIHPSLLPKYRGPTPVQTAILNGDKITGVSIMKLDKEIDHGPILKQEKEKILSTDTSESLYGRLFAKGANLLPKTLDKYLKDNLMPQTQDHTKATFTKPLTRQDGYVDISKLETRNSKSELERKIRAYYPWPGVFTKLKIKNEKLKIIKLLPFGKLQVEGKRPISYKDFLNGYPNAESVIIPILK